MLVVYRGANGDFYCVYVMQLEIVLVDNYFSTTKKTVSLFPRFENYLRYHLLSF